MAPDYIYELVVLEVSRWQRQAWGKLLTFKETGMMFKCKKCKKEAEAYPGDDCFDTGMCYRCFEASLEDWEDNRRARLAERNEY